MATTISPTSTAGGAATVAPAPAASSASSLLPRGMGSMKSEEFFKILVTELRQQDPFEPAKTSDMINNVSQIRGIELSTKLTDTLDQLTQQQHASQIGEMIGKYVVAEVTGDDGSKSRVEGIVTGVHFDTDGAAVLELDSGQSVPAAKVTRITSPEQAELEKNTAAGGTGAVAAGTTAATANT